MKRARLYVAVHGTLKDAADSVRGESVTTSVTIDMTSVNATIAKFPTAYSQMAA